jgi:hypothetical protein
MAKLVGSHFHTSMIFSTKDEVQRQMEEWKKELPTLGAVVEVIGADPLQSKRDVELNLRRHVQKIFQDRKWDISDKPGAMQLYNFMSGSAQSPSAGPYYNALLPTP